MRAYKCITSYESGAFERFAYCILQKNNCMGNSAAIPAYPAPACLASFRGQPLDLETAQNIFIGHIRHSQFENPLARGRALLPWSWKVVCGQNPAYDQFACQHQLFYRDPARPRRIWYDPVFRVTTLDGRQVWRRRHYKVLSGATPGEFRLSVLDNGVLR